jgi:hypothetical protein
MTLDHGGRNLVISPLEGVYDLRPHNVVGMLGELTQDRAGPCPLDPAKRTYHQEGVVGKGHGRTVELIEKFVRKCSA